jgi:hypothetical protein
MGGYHMRCCQAFTGKRNLKYPWKRKMDDNVKVTVTRNQKNQKNQKKYPEHIIVQKYLEHIIVQKYPEHIIVQNVLFA